MCIIETSLWKAAKCFTYLLRLEDLEGQGAQEGLGNRLFQGVQVKGIQENPFHLFHLSVQGHQVILLCLELVDLWTE